MANPGRLDDMAEDQKWDFDQVMDGLVLLMLEYFIVLKTKALSVKGVIAK